MWLHLIVNFYSCNFFSEGTSYFIRSTLSCFLLSTMMIVQLRLPINVDLSSALFASVTELFSRENDNFVVATFSPLEWHIVVSFSALLFMTLPSQKSRSWFLLTGESRNLPTSLSALWPPPPITFPVIAAQRAVFISTLPTASGRRRIRARTRATDSDSDIGSLE